ncbi:hypothetical protein [Fodinibius halophilus]|uniref:Lipoprotein n=1 Tax=Fodinibius halophilus TaxID=1736908 RepID=A0A6M1T7P5_9BACT|nr:hypothetical protein [Fodinibius halophilus]NGP90277.1 hypothetical protein [Fodinibius halophilus]
MKRFILFSKVILLGIILGGCYPYATPYTSSYGTNNSSNGQELCVKYQTQSGWSKGYSVDVNVMKGSTLNQKTGTYNYNSYSTYAIIFWSEDQASIIELSYFSGSFTAYGTQGTDQRGRKWQLSKTTLCY